jgi:outer membrane lipoprotein carrier protein
LTPRPRTDPPSLRPPLFVLFLLLPLLTAWADGWEGMREAARGIVSIEARFVQTKTLPMLARPFVSEGRFFYQAPDRLRWEYDRPARSVLIVNGRVAKRFFKDREAWREDAGAALPVMQTVMEEILHWQQGRFDANPHFQAALVPGPEPKVTLTPRDPAWRKIIQRIELVLSRQPGVMKTVRVIEDDRSFTLLEFNRVAVNRPLPDALFVEAGRP